MAGPATTGRWLPARSRVGTRRTHTGIWSAGWRARSPPRQSRLRDVESAGREIGRELAPDGSFSAHDAMRTALATLGFQPELDVAGGLLDVIAPKATMTGFVPKDPEPAGCLIEVKGLDRPTPTAENAT